MSEINKEQKEDTGQEAKVALVTGSSRGIGRAIASTLAEEGYQVCINYASESSRKEAEELACQLSETFGIETLAHKADVSEAQEASTLVDKTVQTFGRIDVLVNNAGITKDKLIARMKEEDFDSVIAVNLKGCFNCCKAVSSYMMKQRYGRIINIGSIVGVCGNAGQANYAASKAGIIGLSKSLAKELAPRNINVNVVSPGFIETDMTDSLSSAQQETIQNLIASKRLGTPEDVAALVAFLAGESAGYITGQVIGIDGGLSL